MCIKTNSSIYRILFMIVCICYLCLAPVWAHSDKDSKNKDKDNKDAAPSNVNKMIMVPAEKLSPIQMVHFDKPPVIDGKLDDEVWHSAATFKDFYQRRPGENIAPSRPTEVLMGYDAKTLYIAFHAYDEPDKVRATIAKRDDIFNDDYVGVILDTFNDKRKGYEFFFNPLGVQQDGFLTEDQGDDFSIDVVMQSKGALTEDGYVVEVAIPFKSIRYQAGKDKPWGIQLFRGIQRFNQEQDTWLPISRDRSDFLAQSGQIVGFEGVSAERTLEIIPTLTFAESGKRVATMPSSDAGRFVNSPLDFEPGLNLKLSLSSKLTLDAAIKPDFAQVEADSTVITANQRFPIFFAEKRPFFLEGIDIFQTPLFLVNTRTIIAPNYAAKLTGKEGRTTFGLLVAADGAPGHFTREERDDPTLQPTIAKFLNKNAYISVLRVKRDIGDGSQLGFIATNYSFIEDHNSVAGFDGRFRLDPKTTFTFHVVGTTSRRPFFSPEINDNIYRTGNGLGYTLNYDYTSRNFGYFVSSTGRTRDFRADVGFTRRTNTNNSSGFIRFSDNPKPKSFLVSKRISNFSQISYDFQGRSQSWGNSTQINLTLARNSYLGGSFDTGYERLLEEEFGAKRSLTQIGAFAGAPERSANYKGFSLFAGSMPSKKYNFNGSMGYFVGTFDFDFGAGPRFPRISPIALKDPNAPLDPGVGHSLDLNASFGYQPTNALQLSLDYTKSRLTRNDTSKVAFDDNIFAFRSTYQFTRFISARARIDYDTLATNVRGQFLLAWTPSPGTSLYVGYNDDLNYRGFSPFTGNMEPGFHRNGRTFFIKMSYLIRKSF